ncbi:hypothetical protein [Bartonella doshiae]|uniref:hypothetical protein n=1 Tax=Bartonella doshiae TaxID=33044 RepID=UPI001ABB99F4|nr:hypothetical protein [Bartonella doshiae]
MPFAVVEGCIRGCLCVRDWEMGYVGCDVANALNGFCLEKNCFEKEKQFFLSKKMLEMKITGVEMDIGLLQG